jgi:hypothetical protein
VIEYGVGEGEVSSEACAFGPFGVDGVGGKGDKKGNRMLVE